MVRLSPRKRFPKPYGKCSFFLFEFVLETKHLARYLRLYDGVHILHKTLVLKESWLMACPASLLQILGHIKATNVVSYFLFLIGLA